MPIRLLRAAVAVMMVAALYVTATFVQVWSASTADERVAVDAIVVLGAAQYDGRPSPVLAARLDHALEVWEAGVAPRVVVTGGKQSCERFTEARASAGVAFSTVRDVASR